MEVQQRLEEKQMVVRDLNLRRSDFEGPSGHGYTEDGCRRCRWAIEHSWETPTTLSHSAACRARLREAIRASGEAGRMRVEASERRRDQWLAKKVEDAPAEGEKELQPAERPAADPPFVRFEDLDEDAGIEELYGKHGNEEAKTRNAARPPTIPPTPHTTSGSPQEHVSISKTNMQGVCF